MEESVIQIISGIMINVNASVKNIIYDKNITFRNPGIWSCKNEKYLASIIDNSVITCDKIIDAKEAKTVTANFNEKNETNKTKNLYILLAFSLITIALLIAVTIYCYLIKYKPKQKHLLSFHVTNNELNVL